MCQCYSRYEPDGEFGHIAEGRLLAIPRADFEEALRLLQAQALPEYEECVYDAGAPASGQLRSWTTTCSFYSAERPTNMCS